MYLVFIVLSIQHILCQMCRLDSQIILSDNESRVSWTSLDDLGEVVGVAMWPSICRLSESRMLLGCKDRLIDLSDVDSVVNWEFG